MKIISYDNNIGKNKIINESYNVCMNSNFPVTYDDVYNHLFGNDNSILKLLINDNNSICGFGVFDIYNLLFNDEYINMLYLSGMVIDKKYQGNNISQDIIKQTYKELKTSLISLRTQNIAMAKSLLNLFDTNVLKMPGYYSEELLNSIKTVEPFKNVNNNFVIKNCYQNQLYPNLDMIKKNFNIELNETDALAVIVAPKIFIKK